MTGVCRNGAFLIDILGGKDNVAVSNVSSVVLRDKRRHARKATNVPFVYTNVFEGVLINLTGCDQGQSCDVSAGPL